jgi:hypothetical protein
VSALAYPESFDEQEWDDNLDGEGEPDTTWSVEDHDADSNESSVTLSSKTSSKRNHTEFDEDDSAEVVTETSPGRLYMMPVTQVAFTVFCRFEASKSPIRSNVTAFH